MTKTIHQKFVKDFVIFIHALFKIDLIREYSDEIWRFPICLSKNKKRWTYQSFAKYQDIIYKY